jgi:hypothetical protein
MKELKRLNIQRPYNPQPVANSGHRYVNLIIRNGKTSYYVYVKKKHSRTFREKKFALCYKFIMLLKIKSNII